MILWLMLVVLGGGDLDSVRALFRQGMYLQALEGARKGKAAALDAGVREAYAYLEVLSLYQLQRWEEALRAAQEFLQNYPRGVRRGYVAYAGARSAVALERPLAAFRLVIRGYEDAETRELQEKLAGVMAVLWGVDTLQAREWLDRPAFRRRAREEARDILVWLPMGGERHPVGRAFLRGFRMGLGTAQHRLRVVSGQHPELTLRNRPPLVLVGPLLSREVGPIYPFLDREVVPAVLPLALAPMKLPPPWIVYHLEGDLRYLDAAVRVLTEVEAETVVVLFEQPPYEPLARRLKRMLPSVLPQKESARVVVRLFPMEHRTSSVLEKLDIVRTMDPPWVVLLAQSEVMEWVLQAHARDSLPSLWVLPPHTRGHPLPGYAAWGTLRAGWNDLSRLRKKVRSAYRSRYREDADGVALRGFDVGWMIREALRGKPRNGLELTLLLRRRGVFYGVQSTWVMRPRDPFWIAQPEVEEEVGDETQSPAEIPHP